MSHLAHTVALKTKLAGVGITDPEQQKLVVENAYLRGIIKYLFTFKYVFGGYTEEVQDRIYAKLGKWNNISPIRGPLIVEKVKKVVRDLTQQALAGGKFTPIENAVPEFDELNCEVFVNLMNWLFDELVTDND